MIRMQILVTGSSGFVGKALVKELVRLGHTVEGFDASSGQNILELGQLKKAVKGKNVVFHLAALLDETKSKQMIEINVNGTENVIEASAKEGIEQLIYLSTAGVHALAKGKVNEKSEIVPETRYETSKARAEKIVWESQEMLPITIIRSALILGPNNYWKGIAKLASKNFPIIGSGENHFQTIYINDLVSALTFVLAKEECFGEVYLAAGEDAPTLKKLYTMIREELGIKGEVKTIPLWVGKALAIVYLLKSKLTGKKTVVLPQHVKRLVRERYYSTEKIKAAGWKAKVGLEEAVQKTLKELKTNA
jgi:nucleoside-diphosphate-sugar epimerase